MHHSCVFKGLWGPAVCLSGDSHVAPMSVHEPVCPLIVKADGVGGDAGFISNYLVTNQEKKMESENAHR